MLKCESPFAQHLERLVNGGQSFFGRKARDRQDLKGLYRFRLTLLGL
jgi:hypothetical protein